MPDTPEGRVDDLFETALAEGFCLQAAQISAKVEHPFRVIKQQFGFQKTRLRGMVKNPLQGECVGSTHKPIHGPVIS